MTIPNPKKTKESAKAGPGPEFLKVTPGTDFEVSKSPGVLFEVIVFEDRSDAPRSDEETRERMSCVHGFNGKRLKLG